MNDETAPCAIAVRLRVRDGAQAQLAENSCSERP